MAFNLTITFRGLFLFVPDGKFLHVLLPRTEMLGAHHLHHPKWYWHGGGLPAHPFQDVFVDLSKVPSEGAVPLLPRSLADIAPHNDCSIKSEHLDAKVHQNLIAVIRLSAPSDITPGDAAIWELGGKTGYLTNKAECLWPNLAISSLEFTLTNRNGAVETKKLPHSEDGWNLTFEHLPLPEHEHPIKKGDPATHFKAYYAVCGSKKEGPLPCLRQSPPNDPAASTFTCMLGQAPVTG